LAVATPDVIGDNPIQPRTDSATIGIEPVTALEGDQKRVCHYVVSRVRTQPAGYVPMQLEEVRVENSGECMRVTQ
jgi:hypothetical protein